MSKAKFVITPTGEEKEWNVTLIREEMNFDVDEDQKPVTTVTTHETHYKTINLQGYPLSHVNHAFFKSIEDLVSIADKIEIYGDINDA